MRAGSKGVPNKNLHELNGKPLMAYTIEQAIESGLFEHVMVSTDSKQIFELAKNFGAEAWFLRPTEQATDEAPKIPVIQNALVESEKHFGKKFDVIIDLDVTSPLRSVADIKQAYLQFIEEDAEILITACPARKNPYFNMVEKLNGRVQIVKEHDPWPVRRQDAPQVYDMNSSIYIWKRRALIANNNLFSEKTSLFIMPQERSVDIDNITDLCFVKYLLKNSALNG